MFPLNPLRLESTEAFKYWEILHLEKSGFLASLKKIIRSGSTGSDSLVAAVSCGVRAAARI